MKRRAPHSDVAAGRLHTLRGGQKAGREMEGSHGEYRHLRAQVNNADLRCRGGRGGPRVTEDPNRLRVIYSGAGKAAQGARADRGVDGELLHVERAELARLTGTTPPASASSARRTGCSSRSAPPIRAEQVARELAG
jgi:hypothetical protein